MKCGRGWRGETATRYMGKGMKAISCAVQWGLTFVLLTLTACASDQKPEADSEAPGQITDLVAFSRDGEVRITWTAPGDDGYEGRATLYEAKRSVKELTEESWDDALLISNMPVPQIAGSVESHPLNTQWNVNLGVHVGG